MRLFTLNHVGAAILSTAFVFPLASIGQAATAATPAPAAQTGTQPGAETDAMSASGQSRQAMVEQRIADMHATLKITTAQEPQWNSFAQVMLDNAQAMDMLRDQKSANRETQSADQILKQYAEITQQHAQNVQKLSAAFDALYPSLTPEQKKTADEMFRARAEAHDQKQGAATQGQTKNGG